MELTNEHALPVGRADAWSALNDIELLRLCIPGCEAITPAGDEAWDVAMMAAVGPLKARFKGKLKLADLNPPESYTLVFEAQGGPAGHGKGTALVVLETLSVSETMLRYSVQASVGGKVAQIGSRLVDLAAQKMAADFFETFIEQLQQRHPPAPADEGPPPGEDGDGPEDPGHEGLVARMMAWLRRLAGKPA